MRHYSVCLLTALCLCSPILYAQAAPSVPVVLHAARLLDVRAGSVLQPGEVLVEGERIRAVGASVEHPPVRSFEARCPTFGPLWPDVENENLRRRKTSVRSAGRQKKAQRFSAGKRTIENHSFLPKARQG
jgi:hypothetical protein